MNLNNSFAKLFFNKKFVVLTLFFLNLIFRFFLLSSPGYEPDIHNYKNWFLSSALGGLPSAYANSTIDYPPLILYIFYPLQKIYFWIHSASGVGITPGSLPFPDTHFPHGLDSTFLTMIIKASFLFFDLVIGSCVYFLITKLGTWGDKYRSSFWGWLGMILYLWNPAVMFDTGHWGQADSIHTAFLLMAFIGLFLGRIGLTGYLLVLACMMKPQAVPLVPFFIIAIWQRYGLVSLVRFGAFGFLGLLMVFLPFILAGNFTFVIEKTFTSLDSMPLTSANAHNLWWLIEGGWRDANRHLWGGHFTPKSLSLLLFGLCYTILVWKNIDDLRCSPKDNDYKLLFLAGTISTTFFFLSTHMHENYLFTTIPLFLCVAGPSFFKRMIFISVSLCSFLNMLLHDLHIPYSLGWLSTLSPHRDPFLDQPYTWFQFIGSYVNSVLVGLIVISCLYYSIHSKQATRI